MRPIRRAAVSGLLALWLAPLPNLPGSQASGAATGCEDCAASRDDRAAPDAGPAPREEPRAG